MVEEIGKNSINLVTDLGEDGSRVLYKQLVENAKIRGNTNYNVFNPTITRVASCFVSGVRTPSLNDYCKEQNEIILTSSSYRQYQRVVSERDFHGVPGLRQDCILIQGKNEGDKYKPCLWVGEALALIRLKEAKVRKDAEEENESEYVFVQYFDITPPVDAIDNALNCIRLQWAHGGSKDMDCIDSRQSEPVKWFDLLPVSTVRGLVHVVRGDYGVEGICATKDVESIPWYDQFFYVNRFYFDST